MPPHVVAALLVPILACAAAFAAGAPDDPSKGSDWPHVLGPNYDGSSPEKGLLREWPAEGPKVLWRAPIGQGWSSPSVAGNDVVAAMTEFEKDRSTARAEWIVCLDAATGRRKWEYSYKVKYTTNSIGWSSGGVRSTPAITDKCVYSIDPVANIVCLNRKDGKLVWAEALAPEFFYPKGLEQKGCFSSPFVYNNVLIVHNRGEKCVNYVMALDALTGKLLWMHQDAALREKTRPGANGQTPVLATFNNEPCAVLCYDRYVRAFRISDGKEMFRFSALPDDAQDTQIPSPLVVGNRIVIVPELTWMVCVEVDRQDPAFPAKPAWTSTDFYGFCSYHQFVHHDGYLYGIDAYSTDGNKVPEAKLNLDCIDLKTGKLVWKQPGFSHGYSLITADGLLFARSFQTLWLIEATPKGFAVKGKMEKLHNVEERNVLFARGLTDCVAPVLSRGKLYVRCPEELLCIDVRGAGRQDRAGRAEFVKD